jgi:CRP/FNR family transcriptional regulator, cyclic AMP receptor protein
MKSSLSAITLFRVLAPARVHAIEQACDWREVHPGQEIVGHLDTSRLVGFLVEGRARSVIYAASGTAVAFGEIKPGSMFGEIAAIDGAPRTVGVEAVERCLVATLDHQRFIALVQDEPAFALALLKQICANIRGLTERVIEFSTLPVNSRVQAELLRLADTSGRSKGGAIVIPDVPTHADFAARVSTHREAVTRELSRLVRVGVLAKSEDGLAIIDVPRLRDLVREANER